MSQYRKVPKGAVLRSAMTDRSYHDANTERKAQYRAMKAARAKARKGKK